MKMVKKYPFDSTLSPGCITARVDSTSSMSEVQLLKVIQIFNQYGIVLIDNKHRKRQIENLLCLTPLLGRTAQHNLTDRFGVYRIRPSKTPNLHYPGTSNVKHPLHTDGAFLAMPEKVVALQCIQPAEIGGETLLASSQRIIDHLIGVFGKERVNDLYQKDCIHIDRDGEKASSPFLQNIGGNNNPLFRFRDDTFAKIEVSINVIDMYQEIKNFLSIKENHLEIIMSKNQIIVIDNHSVLHGRNEFPISCYREYNRANFHADGELKDELKFGVTV